MLQVQQYQRVIAQMVQAHDLVFKEAKHFREAAAHQDAQLAHMRAHTRMLEQAETSRAEMQLLIQSLEQQLTTARSEIKLERRASAAASSAAVMSASAREEMGMTVHHYRQEVQQQQQQQKKKEAVTVKREGEKHKSYVQVFSNFFANSSAVATTATSRYVSLGFKEVSHDML